MTPAFAVIFGVIYAFILLLGQIGEKHVETKYAFWIVIAWVALTAVGTSLIVYALTLFLNHYPWWMILSCVVIGGYCEYMSIEMWKYFWRIVPEEDVKK